MRNVDSAGPRVVEYGDRVVPIRLDLEDPASITAAAKTATDVDVVVNNAGVLKNATAIFDAIAEGRFHVWPDSMAKQVGNAYQSFAENVVEANMQESPA